MSTMLLKGDRDGDVILFIYRLLVQVHVPWYVSCGPRLHKYMHYYTCTTCTKLLANHQFYLSFPLFYSFVDKKRNDSVVVTAEHLIVVKTIKVFSV